MDNRGKHASIRIHSTDKDVMDKVREVAGCGHIHGPYSDARKESYKSRYTWKVGKREHVYAIACSIFQVLGIRRKRQIKDVINHMGYTK